MTPYTEKLQDRDKKHCEEKEGGNFQCDSAGGKK